MPVSNTQASTNIVVYGRTGSTDGYAVRDFLTRSVVQFEWIEIKGEEDCTSVLGIAGYADLRFPIVQMPTGERLFAPTVQDLAHRLGWIQTPKYKEYDVSIYGAGPAGLSAAVYAASEGLRTVIIERHAVGGQAGTSSMIENYLGFPNGIRGADLAEKARQQAVKFGAEIILMREGVNATFSDNRINVRLADGSRMVAKSNICATGVEYRKLSVPGEDRLLGNGVFYGAGSAEAPFCQDKRVYVIGGGNSAGQAAMHLAEYAERVTLLVRGASLSDTMSDYLSQRLASQPNIEILTNTEVSAFEGESALSQIALLDKVSGKTRTLPTDRVFVCIGGAPNTEWAKDTDIKRDFAGYLITGPDLLEGEQTLPSSWYADRQPYYLETSVAGSFAIGDVRHGSIKRVASAVGEGAMAVSFVHRFMRETHGAM